MIELQNVALRYGRGPHVLRDVDFNLRAGSFSLSDRALGRRKDHDPAAAFHVAAADHGLHPAFRPERVARLAGEARPTTPAHRDRFQDFRLLDHLTTWENVALPLRVVGKRIGDYREDVTDLLQWVGLGDRMYAYPPVLSGGEKQRAAIARAVIGKPELLLADEPTGNVDPQMARRLRRLFIELNRLGTSVIIATHDFQLMKQFKAPRLELHEGHVRII